MEASFDNLLTAGGALAGHVLAFYFAPYGITEFFIKFKIGSSDSVKRHGFYHYTSLTNHKDQRIKAMSPSILYSAGPVDVSKTPLVVTVPVDAPELYRSVSFYTADTMGEYVYSAWDFCGVAGADKQPPKERKFMIVGPGWQLQGKDQETMDYIVNSPTNKGVLIQRIIPTDPKNVAAAVKTQKKLKMVNARRGTFFKPPEAHITWKTYMSMSLLVLFGLFLNLQAFYVDRKNPLKDPVVQAKLRKIFFGMFIGALTLPLSVLGDLIFPDLSRGAANEKKAPEPWHKAGFKSGKSASTTMYQRFYLASHAPLGLSGNEAIYFFAKTDTNGNPLNTANRYKVKLRDDLPARWWSFTAYSSKCWLMENPYNRYSVGATELGFTVGASPTSPASPTENVQREVLLQPDEPPEKDGLTPAWIPIGGTQKQPFMLCLRMYKPTKNFDSSADYGQMPIIEKI